MGVFQKIGKNIGDLSQLKVQTFTGDLSAFIDTTAGTETEDDNASQKTLKDWQALLNDAIKKGQVSLVAVSKLNIDGDTELFISETAPGSVLQAHNNAVVAAQQVRQGLLETFSDVLGIG